VVIRVTSDLDPALRYFNQLEERFAALGAFLTHGSAQYVRDAVAEGQSGDRDGEQMRQALVVARIMGPELNDANKLPKAHAVWLDTERVPKAKLRELGPQDILYVRAKTRRAVRVAPEIEILMRFSPWTPDLLPFFPSKRQAVLVYRKVNREEVDGVRDARLKDAPQWRAALDSAGIPTAKPRAVPLKVEVTPDLVFYAARQEFGGGKRRASKLWRKAVRRLVGSGVSSMMRRPGVDKLLGDPKDGSWRKLAKISVPRRITEQQVLGFDLFQKRLTG